jgi:hypothetical protein
LKPLELNRWGLVRLFEAVEKYLKFLDLPRELFYSLNKLLASLQLV